MIEQVKKIEKLGCTLFLDMSKNNITFVENNIIADASYIY